METTNVTFAISNSWCDLVGGVDGTRAKRGESRATPEDVAPSTNKRERNELAGSTGLEPAASGVTGRRSNQLNYDPNRTITKIGELVNWNRELKSPSRSFTNFQRQPLVGGTGFEPVTAGV